MAAKPPDSYADCARRVRRLGDPAEDALDPRDDDTAQSVADSLTQLHDHQSDPTDILHPTKVTPGETLPEGYSCSYGGLLRNLHQEIEVDQDIVRQEIDYLSQYVTIAFFLGGRPPEAQLYQCFGYLQAQVNGSIILGRNLGRSFFLLESDSPSTIQNLLLLTPYRSTVGICIFQWWMAGFDLNADRGVTSAEGRKAGMKIPTWVTLRHVPNEFRGVVEQIAAGIGKVLGTDPNKSDASDPRFCLALASGKGCESSINVTNALTKVCSMVLID